MNQHDYEKALAAAHWVHCSEHEWPQGEEIRLVCLGFLKAHSDACDLRQQVADLEADRKRLDLIERRKLKVEPYGQRWLAIHKDPRMDGSHVREGRTLREAIDGWLKEAECPSK